MKRPHSLRRLLHPHDHRSLEDIALHPQLGVLRAQPLELLDVAGGQPLRALAGLPPRQPLDLLDLAGGQPPRALAALPRLEPPVAQRPLVDPQVTGDLGDRLVRLLDDPDRSLAELSVVPLADLWHRYPL